MHSFFSTSNYVLGVDHFLSFINPLDFYFKHPTTIQVSGPTRCGKTRFVRCILEEQLIQPFATRIIWVFSEWQPDYDIIRER